MDVITYPCWNSQTLLVKGTPGELHRSINSITSIQVTNSQMETTRSKAVDTTMNASEAVVGWWLVTRVAVMSQMFIFSRWRHIPRYCGESTGHRWFPLTKASNAELCCFLWLAPEQTVEQTIGKPVIWDTIAHIITSLWYYQMYENGLNFNPLALLLI